MGNGRSVIELAFCAQMISLLFHHVAAELELEIMSLRVHTNFLSYLLNSSFDKSCFQ